MNNNINRVTNMFEQQHENRKFGNCKQVLHTYIQYTYMCSGRIKYECNINSI